MAQNYQMGAMMAPPPAAPVNPTAVNFQSDPSMRAQFKGFMSGLSAQRSAPMQAPMQSPMNAPLPMPAPMQSVDIFQPQPMGMAMGGAVPRQTMMGGMPHMLSYITPGEAAALSAMGGTGQPGPGGVPSFVYDEAGMGFSTSSAPSMGDASFDYSGGGRNDFDAFQDSSDSFTVGPINQVYSGAGATAARNLAAEQRAARDALSELMASEALKQDRQRQEDLARDITKRSGTPEIEEGFGPYSQVIGTTETPFAENNIKSIRDKVDTIFDIDTTAPDLLSLDAFGPSGPNLDFSDPTLAPTNARTVDIASPIGVPAQIDFMRDAAKALDSFVPSPIGIPDEIQMRRDANAALNASAPAPTGDTIGGVDQVGVSVGAPSVGPQFDNLGALGAASIPTGGPSASQVQSAIDAARGRGGDSYTVVSGPLSQTREEFLTKGASQPEGQSFLGTLLDTLTGREYPSQDIIEQGIVDATNARTTITGDERRQDMSALDQLAKRAGQQGTGILGALTNFGARNAANMYEDIVNKGYEPVYDARGQIVATRVPGTDILGRGSVEGRIPGANTGGGGGGSAPAPAQVIAEEIAKISNAPMASYTQTPSAPVQTSPAAPAGAATPAAIPGLLRGLGFGYGGYRPVPGISANLNSAADDFLNLLSGAAPRNFAFGGSVSSNTGGYDEAGLDAFGGSGASVADITSGAKSASGQDLSFSNDDGGDNNVVASMSQSQDDGASNLATSASNLVNQQQQQEAAARDIAMQKPQQQQLQQVAPQQSIRDRISSVQEASSPSFASMLSDLFNFSAPEGTLSDLERTQLDVRGRMAQRGSDYYGQNIPQQLSQDLTRAGMTAQPMAATLQRGIAGGQLQNVPVAAQYEGINPYAAGIQQGVQMKGEMIGLGGRYNQ